MDPADQQTISSVVRAREKSPNPPPDISIIIVNWNSKDYVRQCLASLSAHCRTVDHEVIVVDGGSFDGCAEMLAREFPSVIFVQSPDNVGFARANNLGARHAAGRCLLLLNPDTEFIEDSLAVLHAVLAARPDAGAVGCRLLNSDRSLQTSCVQAFPTVLNQMLDSEFLRERFPRSSLWGMESLYRDSREPMEVEALSGACILLKRSCFEAVDGFSENYFMYGEDLDLCFKLRQAGRKVWHIPTASVLHHGGGSSRSAASDFSHVMMRVSVHRFIRTHRGRVAAFAYRLSTAMIAVARLLLIGPLMLLGDRVVRHGAGSLRKWTAILSWSCGLSALPSVPVASTGPATEIRG